VDALGHRRQRRRPGVDLQAIAVEVGLAAEALPAADRHQQVEAQRLGLAGEREVLLPGGPKRRFGRADGAAVADVAAEDAELDALPCDRTAGERPARWVLPSIPLLFSDASRL